METFYTPVHWDTIKVLVANGYYVSIPKQQCCGALAHHAGETDIAKHLAKDNITSVMAQQPTAIVLNSAGCGASLKHYDTLLADDPQWAISAKVFASKVIDVMALLAKKPLAPFTAQQSKEEAPITATYHPPCHLHHAQGVITEPLQVLQQLPAITWVPLPSASNCCGSAGIYNVEQPDLSQAILNDKVAMLKQTGATLVATGNPGCLLQISQGLRQASWPMAVLHPIELLARYYA
jgi:glycolate oxidase iron-sulfur subunit